MVRQEADEMVDKKRAIFESTLALIRDRGFHGAPMSLVAKNAGVAAGTIYHYFESKEKLICALYDYNRERVKSVIQGSLSEKGSVRQQLQNVWTSLYEFYIAYPNVLIFFEQFVNSPFNADKYPNHFRGALYTFFAAANKAGKIKSIKPELLVVMLMATITATAKLRLFAKVRLTRNDLGQVVDTFWEGIKK